MELGLTGKTALVTGSTAGIGFAIAKSLAQEGVSVIINGRTGERVNNAVEQIKATVKNSNVKGIAADFSDVKQIEQLIAQLPAVDILVNNVAVFEPKPFAAITDADWLKFFEINVLSGVRLSRAYFDKMLQKGWGRIIFISSESALQIPEEMIHYGFSKTAQLAVARGLAELTRGTGVTVNCVLPGPTLSEGVGTFIQSLAKQNNKTEKEMETEFFKTMRPTSIVKRFLQPEEIAHTVTYLASPLASATNGAAVRTDGGVVKAIV